MNHSMPGLAVHHHSQSPPKPMSIESMMPSNHLILCCPFLEVRNRFKGLDLIDRVPDEPWMEVCYIVLETGIKTIPKKKKCKKAKWVCEEALQIAVKRREVKSRVEKERYSHLNAEF